jgi:hypothetical protein
MCRGTNACSELGTDPAYWPKLSPLSPPDWFEEQLDIFQGAVRQFVIGGGAAFMAALSCTRSVDLRDWYIEHGQTSGGHRDRVLGLPKPLPVALDQRDRPQIGAILEDQVFRRDGFRCRYCGIRLVSNKILKTLIRAVNSSEFRRGPRNVNTHGILCIFYPSADHVEPRNLGGRTNMANLVTSCPPCNFGKGPFTVGQIGVENPLLRAPVVGAWDGLVSQLEGIKRPPN